MKNRLLMLTLGVTIVAIGPAGTAPAQKKPKPYTSESVSIQMGHPVFNGNSGSIVSLTAQEFMGRLGTRNPAYSETDALLAYVDAVARIETDGTLIVSSE